MPWFSVDLLFRAIHNGIETDTDVWEERIVVINANDEQDARNECLKLGKSEEHEYFANAQIVKWTFVQIERVCEIEGNSLVNGLQVFTRYLRNSEVVSILTPFE